MDTGVSDDQRALLDVSTRFMEDACPLGQAQGDEVLERAPGRSTDGLHRRSFVALQTHQRAVDVQIGRVNDAQGA